MQDTDLSYELLYKFLFNHGSNLWRHLSLQTRKIILSQRALSFEYRVISLKCTKLLSFYRLTTLMGMELNIFLCSKILDFWWFEWYVLPIQKEDPIDILCVYVKFTEKSMIFIEISGPSHLFFNAISKRIELEGSAWSWIEDKLKWLALKKWYLITF